MCAYQKNGLLNGLLATGLSFFVLAPACLSAADRVSTNGIVRQPRDTAAEIAFNPFVRLQTNAQGQVLLDYQYRSTNAPPPATRPVIDIHPEGATGRNARHLVHFRANLKDEDAIEIVLPDNQVLQGRAVALSISDGRGHRVWLGELQD